MKEFLVFQLQAPLSSWGEPAVGEFRGTAEYPSKSAVAGILGAALGLARSDEAAHAALRDGYGYAIGMQTSGTLLRDYHTAQVPPRAALKGRPLATRRDELRVPKHDLTTILSTRDYRQNAASLVALQICEGIEPPYSLAQLVQALTRPCYVLYLGRKACPPGAPLWAQVITADSASIAFGRYAELHQAARSRAASDARHPPLEALAPVHRIAFDDSIDAGVPPDLTQRRKDHLIHRRRWQFSDRDEHVALVRREA